MKKIAFLMVAVFLTLFGVTLAQQSVEEKKNSSMKHRMQEFKPDEGSGAMMQGMHGMMGMMMKMMDQCNEMMKAAQQQRENDRPTQKN
jgi:hypothetical protein